MIFKRKFLALGLLHACAVVLAGSDIGVAQAHDTNPSDNRISGGVAGIVSTGSVGRSGKNAASDVLAVQIALNQVPAREGGAMEDMLVPDAVVGPKTIAAIDRFQSKQFDNKPDGRIDPNGATLARLNELVAAQSLNARIVQVARGEELFWQNGQRNETDAAVSLRLVDYWAAVGQDFSEAQMQDEEFHAKWPWSAAFVSWVMQRAGAGEHFKYSAAHRVYTSAAKHNRQENNDNPFKAFRVAEKKPQVGGVIVNYRSGSLVSYDNVDNGDSHKTHGDIVIATNGKEAIVIGGNVGNSVRKRTVALNDQGHLESEAYFAVVIVEED